MVSRNPTLSIRSAIADDLPHLARMNRQSIEDERSRNPMSLDSVNATPDGAQFWASLGFQPYCTTLHLQRHGTP